MKKVLFFGCFLIYGTALFAQSEFYNKNGKEILPRESDFSIGIDATPFFSYLGNIFNNSENNRLDSIGGQIPFTISGKYFLRDHMAIRASIGARFSNFSSKAFVDDLSNADTALTLSDETINKAIRIAIGGGLEFRRGHGRLQAFYGPQVTVLYSKASTEFNYGNDLSEIAPAGTPSFAARLAEQKQGDILDIELGGFVGVEYFFAPKISIATEFGISFRYVNQNEGEVILETFERTNLIIIPIENRSQITNRTPGFSLLELDTKPTAAISLNFYF